MAPVPVASSPMLVQYLENQVCAGFPSPAEDLGAERIDLASLLGTEREDTFFMKVSGQSMVDLGIFNNDIVVVSRGRRPRNGHIVVATQQRTDWIAGLLKALGNAIGPGSRARVPWQPRCADEDRPLYRSSRPARIALDPFPLSAKLMI